MAKTCPKLPLAQWICPPLSSAPCSGLSNSRPATTIGDTGRPRYMKVYGSLLEKNYDQPWTCGGVTINCIKLSGKPTQRKTHNDPLFPAKTSAHLCHRDFQSPHFELQNNQFRIHGQWLCESKFPKPGFILKTLSDFWWLNLVQCCVARWRKAIGGTLK